MNNLRISSANGFSSLAKANVGVLRNKGWELNAYTGKFARVGKFSMKIRGNIAQNFNEVEEMNPLILEALNGPETYQPSNLSYNNRVQVGNALGSIYGLRYKGVYRYDYDHNGYTTASISSYGYAEVDNSGYDAQGNPINTAAAAQRRGENFTCPIAYDADGNMLTDAREFLCPCTTATTRVTASSSRVVMLSMRISTTTDRLTVMIWFTLVTLILSVMVVSASHSIMVSSL